MRTHLPLCLVAVMTFPSGLRARGPEAAKPMAGPAVKVTVDTSETPDLAPWANRAKSLVEKWHPQIADMLKSDGFAPPAEVKLVFKKDMDGVAGTAGSTIYISAAWVREHPEDVGMVVHELTHVIQSYPRYDHVWLVEGLADYVRFYHFEPKTKLPPIDPTRDNYRDGYKTTAQFLAWVERKYDRALVSKLNRALRESKYDDALFKKITSRSLDQLWSDFIESQKR